MYSWTRIVLIAACCSSSPASAVWGAATEWQGAAVKIASEEFVFTDAPFPSAHASTIVETPTGLIAAWFGGTREKHPDVGIWVSRHDGRRWSTPTEVANGATPDGRRYPAWNPVLFRASDGPVWLFYKVGPSPSTWWGLLMRSNDEGRTWNAPTRLPEGILGPIRAKPVQLADGTLLAGSSTEHDGWRVHMEWTRGPAGAWEKAPPLSAPPGFSAIQPTILVCASTHGPAKPQCRHRQRAPRRWPVSAGLQPHARQSPQAADRDFSRRAHLDTRGDARRQSGGVLVPGDDPGPRWTRARHIHVAPRAHQAHRSRRAALTRMCSRCPPGLKSRLTMHVSLNCTSRSTRTDVSAP